MFQRWNSTIKSDCIGARSAIKEIAGPLSRKRRRYWLSCRWALASRIFTSLGQRSLGASSIC